MLSDLLPPPIDIPDGWQLVRLGDICSKIGSGATPTGGQAAYLAHRTRYAFVRSQNVYDRRFSLEGLAFISDEQASRLRGVELRENDILLNITGDGITFGRACLIDKQTLPACVNQHVSIIRVDPKRACPEFVLTFLTHPVIKAYIESFNAGGSRRAITKAHIEAFVLPLPPIEAQREIGSTLQSFDDKITLLQKTNASLEAIAQAIFKSWFVDFDPVRAKMEGSGPKWIQPEMADLFPSEFEESEIGLIPKGWKVASLDAIAEFLNGLAMQKFPVEDEAEWLPVIKIAQLRKGDTEGADRASLRVPSDYVVQDGDVLFSWSGSLEIEIWCGGKGGLNQHLFKVTSKKFAKWFFYLWTKHHLASFREIAANKATTMGHIQRHHLTEAKVVVPPAVLLKGLSSTLEPLFSRMTECRMEVKTLIAIRDSLLPRLMSGKLRVTSLDPELEEVR